MAQIDTLAALLADPGFRQVEALGVAVAGRVDAAGNWHAVNRDTLRAISAAPPGAMLAARFGGRCRAVNDAAAAALAEAALGAGRGARNFACLTVSTGVGGGLVLGGRRLDSGNGLAGHVGLVSSRLAQDRCGSGRIGTVESVAGGRAIAAAAVLAHLSDKPELFRPAVVAAELGHDSGLLGALLAAAGGAPD
ncbi:ROK family protein [Paracoccus sp. (in: a-proteobacteria)]|uniref:ROK family protein n=1 Tax=Paracoccus sp. TaxID=267 RepID=UPI00321FF187